MDTLIFGDNNFYANNSTYLSNNRYTTIKILSKSTLSVSIINIFNFSFRLNYFMPTSNR